MVTYSNHKVCSPLRSRDAGESQLLWFRPRTIVVSICLALTLFSTAPIQAQTVPLSFQFTSGPDGLPEGLQPLLPGVELPPGVQLPPGIKADKESTSKTNAPPNPEEKRLQELLK